MNQDIRICFLGDSFVNGTGDETALGWAGRLCSAANASGIPITYYNLGIRQNTSRDLLLHWENECALRLPDSCDGRVIISCGVNDTVFEDAKVRIGFDESCANLRQILKGAKKYKVILIGPPPVDDDNHNERIQAISMAFCREAEFLGVSYIELYSSLASDAGYRKEIADNDGAHPQSLGYLKIARIVASSPNWWFNAP